MSPAARAARPASRADTGRLLRSSAVVGVGTALSRVTGFVRVAAIAYALGVSTLAGVYSYANETPNIVFELLLGGVLTATLVPLFVKHVEDRDDDATSAVFTVAVIALVGITILGEILAPWIVRLYTLRVSGGDADRQRELATSLLRCFMPQMFFYGVTALATAMLQARRRFAAAAFAPILNNVVVVALFLSIPRFVDRPITVNRVLDDTPLLILIGLGTTAGIAAMAIVLWPALRRAGVHLRFLPGLAPCCGAHHVAALGLDGRLRHREPDRVVGGARPRQRQARRALRVPERVRVLPAPTRTVRGLDHDDGAARAGLGGRGAPIGPRCAIASRGGCD